MKVVYRGHLIDAHREKCLAGYRLLYFSVFRQSDGYECLCDYSEGDDSPAEMVGHLKRRVDAELASADPWGEREDERA